MTLRRGMAGALLCLAVAGCAGVRPPDRPLPQRLAVDDVAAVAWVNAYRSTHGLAAVVRDPALDAVAQAQADAMAAGDVLSHTVAGSLPSRLAAIDRAKGASAENVSAGYSDLPAALAGWRRSPEHDRNLLFAPIRRVGVAGALAPGTRYRTFWAMVMTD